MSGGSENAMQSMYMYIGLKHSVHARCPFVPNAELMCPFLGDRAFRPQQVIRTPLLGGRGGAIQRSPQRANSRPHRADPPSVVRSRTRSDLECFCHVFPWFGFGPDPCFWGMCRDEPPEHLVRPLLLVPPDRVADAARRGAASQDASVASALRESGILDEQQADAPWIGSVSEVVGSW